MSTSDENEAKYGKRIPNVEQKRAYEEMQRAALIAQEIKERGGNIPMDGLNESGQPVSTLGMTDNEKFFAVGRMRDKQQLEGYASYGDKYLGEARNAVREITGRAPIANTPEEFNKLIDKSVAFGGDSSLLTPEGRTRAMQQGVKAGLSYQEADAAVQGAFDFLNKKYGKKDTTPAQAAATTSVGVPPLLAKPEGDVTTSTAPVQTETKPAEKRDTSPDTSASASHRARLRGRAAEGKPTEVIPENMGEPTGFPSPATAIPVKTPLGVTWVDSSGYTYPWKPAPIDPDQYVSGEELMDMVGLPQAWSNLKAGVSSSIGGFSEEYDKAQRESPDTPLRSAAKGAWEFLKRAYPKTDWTKLQ